MIYVALCLALVTGESARDLNTRGFRLYQQKKYAEAAESFAAAIDADASYALPYYNLACVLSLLRARGETCDHDAYRGRIIELLADAVRLDPKRKRRIAEDKDLDAIRDTFGYYKLLGFSPKKPRDLRKILVAVTWYGPSPGAYGPTGGADFHEDGSLTTWGLDFTDDGEVRRVSGEGTWKLDGTRILIRFGSDPKHEAVGALGEDGVLTLDGRSTMTDDPDDCSA